MVDAQLSDTKHKLWIVEIVLTYTAYAWAENGKDAQDAVESFYQEDAEESYRSVEEVRRDPGKCDESPYGDEVGDRTVAELWLIQQEREIAAKAQAEVDKLQFKLL